jgi:DNA-binding YbaB/EbfC family protein
MMNRKMMRQAQQLQNRLAKVQQELEELTVEGSAGGGVVRVTMNGRQEVSEVVIEPEAAPNLDQEDIDLLQDLVAAAVNDASARTQQMAAEKMNAVTGGLNIPGLT